MNNFAYQGSELVLFKNANNWKKYFAKILAPYFGQTVLEVGAGIGSTTRMLCDGSQKLWLCLEPDHKLSITIKMACHDNILPSCCDIITGNSNCLSLCATFDTIVYIDVLEHILDDSDELNRIAGHLNKSGHLVILSPAFNFLFSLFDTSIGHFRRYNRDDLLKLTPSTLKVVKVFYLDSLGFFMSLINKFLLQSSMPTQKQIDIWDGIIIPISKIIDPCICYSIGRSIVGIWSKT